MIGKMKSSTLIPLAALIFSLILVTIKLIIGESPADIVSLIFFFAGMNYFIYGWQTKKRSVYLISLTCFLLSIFFLFI